jgi:hypothetical protein
MLRYAHGHVKCPKSPGGEQIDTLILNQVLVAREALR